MPTIKAIATLANQHAITDLKILLFTLDLWNSPAPTVYIFSDLMSAPLIRAIPYSGKVHIKKDVLNAYTGLNRIDMESRRGRLFATLFADFTAEKTHLMRWALETEPDGVLFCDADICHLAPLPTIPDGTDLALSPHMIRKSDTDKYGVYNAGYLWFKNPELASKWLDLCETSRFFEQGCLEDLAINRNLYEFPVQVNYGWWRLWQGVQPPVVLEEEWGIFREESSSGITVQKQPLQSIHTHWSEKSDRATSEFNKWVLSQLTRLISNKTKKTAALVRFLSKI